MDFQQIRDFVNPAVAQATGIEAVENLSMPVPVAYVPVQLVIDGALSLTSENPVQNKVIAVAIQQLDGRITAIEGQFSEGVTEAVNNWLAAHPEATTTVQDGAITYAKLDANLKGEVDQISELKSALQAYEGGTTGQILRKKSNADNDVEWSDVGAPTDTQVQDAVDDYLDAHPEQTTTVVDGSLTEVKFSDTLKLQTLKDYVTPEMFGAKGDGETDDAQAIQSMFDSGNKVFLFSNKTYLVKSSIDVDVTCDIYFNTTVLKSGASAYVLDEDFEYVIAFKALRIRTHGSLTVRCETTVNIGIYLDQCGSSEFDALSVANARIWGITSNDQANDLNGLIFKSINVAQCGYKVRAKATYDANVGLVLTDISSTTPFFSVARERLFDNRYRQSETIIDDSGYANGDLWNRLVFARNQGTSPFTINSEEPTTGTYVKINALMGTGYNVEGGRNVFIPIGGGLNLQSASSEGAYTILKLSAQSNPIGARLFMGYAGSILTYISEFNAITLFTNSLSLDIHYLYAEAMSTYYDYKFGNGYDNIICVSYNTNPRVFINSLIGVSGLRQGNNITIGSQFQTMVAQYDDKVLHAPFLLAQKLIGINMDQYHTVYRTGINEVTPRNITIEARGFSHTTGFQLQLLDLYARSENRFEPVHIFVHQLVESTAYDDLYITMSDALINAGYTIRGAVNNSLVIHPSNYNYYFEITIVLFMRTKQFCVSVKPLEFVTNTTE